MAKLLLVEDDDLLCSLLTRRLSRAGFRIITANNGMQTIALARTELPALILLDIGLPLLSGWQVAARLRSIPETQAIPILVLTGSPSPDFQEQLVAVGCDGYELKPINFPQLIVKAHWLASRASVDHPASIYSGEQHG